MKESRFLIWCFQFPSFIGERDDLRVNDLALDFPEMLYHVISSGLTDQDCFIQQLHASHRISYEKPSQLESMFPLFLIFNAEEGLSFVCENLKELQQKILHKDFHLGFTENLGAEDLAVVPVPRAAAKNVASRIAAAVENNTEFKFEQIMFNKINCIK